MGSAAFVGTQLLTVSGHYTTLFVATVAFLLFLFRLRLFDEVKDAEHDAVHYPERPLSRGIVTHQWISRMTAIVMIGEFAIAALSGMFVFTLFCIAFVYSLLMYKEFFIPDWLRSHFVLYSLLHEALALPLLFYLYALLGIFSGAISFSFVLLLGMHIGGLFGLEIARKLRRKEGNNNAGDTYTEHLGALGATVACGALLYFSALSALWIAQDALGESSLVTIVIVLFAGALLVACRLFVKNKDVASAHRVFIFGVLLALSPQIIFGVLFLIQSV
jgi:4-hydroxybenzoate polyprenyltransferase